MDMPHDFYFVSLEISKWYDTHLGLELGIK